MKKLIGFSFFRREVREGENKYQKDLKCHSFPFPEHRKFIASDNFLRKMFLFRFLGVKWDGRERKVANFFFDFFSKFLVFVV